MDEEELPENDPTLAQDITEWTIKVHKARAQEEAKRQRSQRANKKSQFLDREGKKKAAMNPTNNPTSGTNDGAPIAGQGTDMQPASGQATAQATPAPRSHAEDMERIKAEKERIAAEKDLLLTKAMADELAGERESDEKTYDTETGILKDTIDKQAHAEDMAAEEREKQCAVAAEEREKQRAAAAGEREKQRAAAAEEREKQRKERERLTKFSHGRLAELAKNKEDKQKGRKKEIAKWMTPAKAPPSAPVAQTPVSTVGTTAASTTAGASTVSDLTQENCKSSNSCVYHHVLHALSLIVSLTRKSFSSQMVRWILR